MKKLFEIIGTSLIFLSWIVSCCDKNERLIKDEPILSDSFITYFYKMDSFDLSLDTSDEEKSIYSFLCKGHSSDYYTKDHNADQFKFLCDKYGDYGLNAYLEVANQASINNFSGITVTSNIDFPGHSAGESLNDIVYVRLSTAKPFIDSGYSDSYLTSDPMFINGIRLITATEGYTEVYKLAKDLVPEDLTLIRNNFIIDFRDRPTDVGKEVLITISFEQENDTPIVNTFSW